MALPRLFPIRQRFVNRALPDVSKATEEAFLRSHVLDALLPGQSVAVCVGSRGISNLAEIVKKTVDLVRARGATPFIVPAMGSHGGGNAEGQTHLLDHYGISEASMGCAVKADMSTTEVGRSPEGIRAYVSNEALKAAHIIAVNRVKPHTEFEGAIESGILKMLCIGLGKLDGAQHYHSIGMRLGFEHTLRTGGRLVLDNAPVLCGLAIVEDSYDQTAIIEALRPDGLEAREEELLKLAKSWVPKLPFDEADVLIVNQMGKDVSGTGMDTKTVGRIMSVYAKEPKSPRITRIAVLDASEGNDGNLLGIGLADFTTERLVSKMDPAKVHLNATAALTPEKARVPMWFSSDIELFKTCFATIAPLDPLDQKVMRIQDTRHLEVVWVSEAYLPEVKGRPDLEIAGPAEEMRFDNNGRLI